MGIKTVKVNSIEVCVDKNMYSATNDICVMFKGNPLNLETNTIDVDKTSQFKISWKSLDLLSDRASLKFKQEMYVTIKDDGV